MIDLRPACEGNIGGEPKFQFTSGGTPLLTMNVAVERRWKDKKTDEWVGKTTWVKVKVWGKEAEQFANCTASGDKDGLTGLRVMLYDPTFELDTWEGNDGKERTDLVATCRKIAVLPDRGPIHVTRESRGGGYSNGGGNGGGNGQRQRQPANAGAGAAPDEADHFGLPPAPDDSDVPF